MCVRVMEVKLQTVWTKALREMSGQFNILTALALGMSSWNTRNMAPEPSGGSDKENIETYLLEIKSQSLSTQSITLQTEESQIA